MTPHFVNFSSECQKKNNQKIKQKQKQNTNTKQTP